MLRATPADGSFSGRISEIRWSTSSSANAQSRQAAAASLAIPWRARAGVMDHPTSSSSMPSTTRLTKPDVSQELARCPVLDGKKRVAVPILVFDPLPDPGPGLVYRERMRVKAHVVGIGLDGVERLQVEEVPSEGSQSKAVGL